MFCPICGNEVKEGMTFCGKCGTPVKVNQKDEKKPPLSKDMEEKVKTGIILAVLYIAISYLFINLLKMENTVAIHTGFDKDVCGYLALNEFLDILLNGTRIFHPTIASTSIAVGIYILVYSVPIFAILAFADTIVSKKSFSMNIAFTIMSVLSGIVLVIMIPITVHLVPAVKQAMAKSSGVIFEDITSVGFTKLIIWAAILLVMIITTCVVTAKYNRRRGQHEE